MAKFLGACGPLIPDNRAAPGDERQGSTGADADGMDQVLREFAEFDAVLDRVEGVNVNRAALAREVAGYALPEKWGQGGDFAAVTARNANEAELFRRLGDETAAAMRAEERGVRRKLFGPSADVPVKTQADEVARIIVAACELIDWLLVGVSGSSLVAYLKALKPTIDRMRAYLDRRTETAEDPWWVARMRATVRKVDEQSVGDVNDELFEVK